MALINEYRAMYTTDVSLITLEEEDKRGIMQRSVAEGEDYLKRFIPWVVTLDELLDSVNLTGDNKINTELRTLYEMLDLKDYTIEERYAVLSMVYAMIQGREVCDAVQFSYLKNFSHNELVTLASPYMFVPKHIKELQGLHRTLLDAVGLKSKGMELPTIDVEDVRRRVLHALDVIQITNYPFRSRDSILSTFNYLSKEINKALNYIITGREEYAVYG